MPGTTELNQVGKREDLSDLIAVADAKGTPVTSSLRKGAKPEAMLFEWQVDGFDTAKVAGVPDGKDVSVYEDAAKYRKKLQGRVQRLWRTPKVSTMAEKVSKVAGVPSEWQRAKAKKMIELKRDVETRILSDLESQPDAGDGVNGSEFRGLGNWIQNGAQAELPVPVEYRTPTGSIYSGTKANFTEDSLSALMQSRYDKTGTSDELTLVAGTDLKRAISNFSRYDVDKASHGHVRMFNNEASEATIFNKVDVYDGDFGRAEIWLSSFLPSTWRGYLLDMRMVELRPHTNPGFRELEDRGGGPNGITDTIVSMVVLHPQAHGKIKPSDE